MERIDEDGCASLDPVANTVEDLIPWRMFEVPK